MFCPKCGFQTEEGAKFCRKCGYNMGLVNREIRPAEAAPAGGSGEPAQQAGAAQGYGQGGYAAAQNYSQPAQAVPAAAANTSFEAPAESNAAPRKSRKKLSPVLTFILGIALAAVLVMILFFTGVMRFGGGASSSAQRIEGAGYDTPEDAIRAYAEALKKQDLDGMISTFAVESYCENYNADMAAGIVQMTNINMAVNNPMPDGGNSVVSALNRDLWKASIQSSIISQMMIMADANKDLVTGVPVHISNDSEDDSVLREAVHTFEKLPDLSTMEIGDVIYAEGVFPKYVDENNIRNLRRFAARDGADGFKSLGLLLTIDGKSAFLCMDTVRYNGRWYNIRCSGMLGALIGMHSLSGGFTYLTGDVLREIGASSVPEALDMVNNNILSAKMQLPEWEVKYNEARQAALDEAKAETGIYDEQKLLDYLEEQQKAKTAENILNYRDEIPLELEFTFDELMDFLALSELR